MYPGRESLGNFLQNRVASAMNYEPSSHARRVWIDQCPHHEVMPWMPADMAAAPSGISRRNNEL